MTLKEINDSIGSISSILGILGFFLAIYTSLPKITNSYSKYSNRKVQKQLSKIEKSIEEHEKLNTNLNYLIVYSFRYLTFILTPILFSSVFSSVTFNIFEITVVNSIIMLPLIWCAGYGTGSIFRSYRFISDKDGSLKKLTESRDKILEKIERNRLNKSADLEN